MCTSSHECAHACAFIIVWMRLSLSEYLRICACLCDLYMCAYDCVQSQDPNLHVFMTVYMTLNVCKFACVNACVRALAYRAHVCLCVPQKRPRDQSSPEETETESTTEIKVTIAHPSNLKPRGDRDREHNRDKSYQNAPFKPFKPTGDRDRE